jgi:hypothetical protein
MDTVLEYIQTKGWQYKISGDEIILKRCVFCGREEWKLYVNRKTRLFLCFRASCSAKGHISKLKKHIGDVIEIEGLPKQKERQIDFTESVEEYNNRLLENEDVIRYLDDNGITLEAINRFSLGIQKWKMNMWLVYPSFIKGIPRYIKYRLLPFDKEITSADKEKGISKFLREKDVPSILFNQDAIDKYDEIIVTEGEKDAISLIMQGYENVVGCTGGADTLKPEWFDVLKEKTKIFLAFDNDEAGEKGATEKWASRLGRGKCFYVQLPEGVKDLTEYFLEGNTGTEFDALLEKSETLEVPGVRSLQSILKEMAVAEDEEADTFPTPWKNVNNLIEGGFRRGDLVIVSAPPGVGKTTMALQISSLLSVKLDRPTLFFCMEVIYQKLVKLFIAHSTDKPYSHFSHKDARLFAMEFDGVPIYFGYSPRVSPTQIQQTFLDARERFGIEFFVFDNLHTLIRGHDKIWEKIGAASKMFKDLAMEMQVPVLLIAQPRKMEAGVVMDYYDIKGSSDMPADADIVILMHRNRTVATEEGTREETFETLTRFIIDKSRESPGGECRLFFDGYYRQFVEGKI